MKCRIFGDFLELQRGYAGATLDPHIFLLTPPNYMNFFYMFKTMISMNEKIHSQNNLAIEFHSVFVTLK